MSQSSQGAELVVIGAGGHAKVVIDAARAAGMTVIACYDDDESCHGSEILGVTVNGPISAADPASGVGVVAVGDNEVRKRIVAELSNLQWVKVVHPRATIAPDVETGEGTVVFAGVVIQPGAVLGRHCIVNTGATVDHDCTLGDFVHVGPGAHLSGNTVMDEGAFLGTASATIQGIKVGAWSTVGVGGVVIRDVPADTIAVGVPAKALDSKI